MTHLRQTLALRSPYTRVWADLNLALCQISEHQEPDRVRLRLPLAGAAGPALQKDVTLRYRRDPEKGSEAPWSVNWQPVGGGPYPDFDGLLTIELSEDHLRPLLVLEGEYTPPLGAAGQAFDAILGARIAEITARELLRSLANEMGKHHTPDGAAAGPKP